MSEPLLESFEKQPAENHPFAVDFSGQLPTGVTLSTVALSACNYKTGATDNSVLNSQTGTVVGSSAIARVKAGTHGITYKITYLATCSDGSIFEEDVLMVVNDR